MEEYARQFRRDIQKRYPKKFRVIKDYRVLQYEVDNILVEKGDKEIGRASCRERV